MKFSQLIEYNMKNIVLENHAQNVMDKLFLDSILKNRNEAFLWINSLKFHYRVCFYYMPS